MAPERLRTMLRWSRKEGHRIEHPQVEAFLADLTKVCRKHGLTLSHEDTQGAFVVEGSDEANILWLNSASIGKSVPHDTLSDQSPKSRC